MIAKSDVLSPSPFLLPASGRLKGPFLPNTHICTLPRCVEGRRKAPGEREERVIRRLSARLEEKAFSEGPGKKKEEKWLFARRSSEAGTIEVEIVPRLQCRQGERRKRESCEIGTWRQDGIPSV